MQNAVGQGTPDTSGDIFNPPLRASLSSDGVGRQSVGLCNLRVRSYTNIKSPFIPDMIIEARMGNGRMKKGQRYRCQNRLCGCEMEVTRASAGEIVQNPKCGCGAEMKRPYVKPQVRERVAPDESRKHH